MSATMKWADQQREMVERQLRRRGIYDQRVLNAMLLIPREEFIPEEFRPSAYTDGPLPIGHEQTISQPYIIALMAQCLELAGSEKVLEVGAGTGYHAAVLGSLAARVIAIELIPELAKAARRNLERTGLGGNITVICADGSVGYPPESPYDAISIAAAAPAAPAAVIEQLKDPGRMVVPVGDRDEQELTVVTKCAGKVSSRVEALCRFVPLLGEQGWR